MESWKSHGKWFFIFQAWKSWKNSVFCGWVLEKSWKTENDTQSINKFQFWHFKITFFVKFASDSRPVLTSRFVVFIHCVCDVVRYTPETTMCAVKVWLFPGFSMSWLIVNINKLHELCQENVRSKLLGSARSHTKTGFVRTMTLQKLDVAFATSHLTYRIWAKRRSKGCQTHWKEQAEAPNQYVLTFPDTVDTKFKCECGEDQYCWWESELQIGRNVESQIGP